MLVYIGTYTQTPNPSPSGGIYLLRFDPADGSLSAPVLVGEVRNPTFLALSPDRTHLYSTGDIPADSPTAMARGCINAFAIEPGDGRLTFLNRQETGAGGTTHLVVDATGRMLVTVSYPGNYVCACPLAADGRIGPPTARLSHTGPLGPNRARQTMPHPHSVVLSPDNRFAFVCDLGMDRVFSYRIDPAHAGLVPNDPPFAVVPPGAGPRHSDFSADSRFFYTVDEMGGSVCVFGYDAARGALDLRQTVSTLPPGFDGVDTSAEIWIHPSGRFLYASNRDISNKGGDSLAVFARDPATGLLTPVEVVPSGGRYPRNFALSPDGGWLLCANGPTSAPTANGQYGNNVVVFRIDSATGRLTRTGPGVTVPMPVCVTICD